MILGVGEGLPRNMDKAALWALIWRTGGGKVQINHSDLPMHMREEEYWIHCTVDPRNDYITLEAKKHDMPPSWVVNAGKDRTYKSSAKVVAADPGDRD